MRSVLLAILLCSIVGAASAASVPPRVEITYRVSVAGLNIGEGNDVFEHDGKAYRVTSESKTVGVAAVIYRLNVHREAHGRVMPQGLRPDSFAELRNGKPKRSARFDWDKKQAFLVDGEREQTVQLPENTWDSTTFGYNFAFSKLDSTALVVYVTDGRRITPYKYAVVGREKLETELGELDTIHVRKVQEGDDKRGFEVWVAVDHYNLPARIRYTEKDGTAFDSVIARVVYPAKQ